jgi:hypothetical protein
MNIIEKHKEPIVAGIILNLSGRIPPAISLITKT